MTAPITFKMPNFPNWMPESAKEHWFEMNGYWESNNFTLSIVPSSSSGHDHIDINDYYKKLVPIFEDNSLEKFWKKINVISPKKTKEFVQELFMYPMFYQNLKIIPENRLSKIETAQKSVLKPLKEALLSMPNSIDEKKLTAADKKKLHELIESQKKQIEIAEQLINEINNTAQFSWPLSRENNTKNAEAIFWLRMNNSLLRKHFGKPFHRENSIIVNHLFNTEYSYEHCAKLANTK